MMTRWQDFLVNKRGYMYLSLLFWGFLIYFFWGFHSMILWTLIFSYLGNSVIERVRRIKWLQNRLLVTVLVYLLFIGIIVFAGKTLIQPLVVQLKLIPNYVTEFLKEYPNLAKDVETWGSHNVNTNDIISYGKGTLTGSLTKVTEIFGSMATVILGLFLSFVFNSSKPKLIEFTEGFERSHYPEIFKEMGRLAMNFIRTLGLVVETQMIICLCNTFLMFLGMWAMGFPGLLVFTLMVFILGFIPVAGVLLSLIPLSIMALIVGGPIKLVEILIFVGLIHMFESYVLHPRLMANATNLPILVTFLTLILGEKIIGAWGLIIGIPTVIFILDVLGVQLKQHHPKKKKPKKGDEVLEL